MPSIFDTVAHEKLQSLVSVDVTKSRFRHWRTSERALADLFEQYAFGEIFWRKSLGRPHTPSLSEGFLIESTEEQWVQDFTKLKGVRQINAPKIPTWRDAPDNAEYWRISFMIPGLVDGRVKDGSLNDNHTIVVPLLHKDVWWTAPGASSEPVPVLTALRVFDPPYAVFVMGKGPIHLSFEVVSSLVTKFDHDGVVKP
jgi:hypothetical protein